MSYAYPNDGFRESASLIHHGISREKIAYYFDQIIWWGALALIPLLAIPHGADKLWWQAAFECCVFGLAMLWIANGFIKGRWEFKRGFLLVPLALLAGYAFVQTLPFINGSLARVTGGTVRRTLTADVVGTYHFLAEWLALVILAKLLLDYTHTRQRVQWLIYVVIAAGVGSAVFGLFRLLAQSAWPSMIIFGQAQGDGFGQFENRNHFALLLEMTLGLALGLLLGNGVKKKFRLLQSGLALLLATTIVLTTSRGGILSMFGLILLLASWFAFSWMWGGDPSSQGQAPRRVGPSIARALFSVTLVMSLVAVMTVGIVNLGGEPLTNRMEKLSGEWGNEDSAHGKRGDVWSATWSLIKSHPLAGSGLGAYYTAITEYHTAPGDGIPASPLNDYLSLFAGGGLVGIALFAWFMVLFVRRVRIRLKSQDRLKRGACVGALGGLLGLAAHSLVDSGLQVPINALIAMTLIVIATTEFRSRRGIA
jgi:O-antigen ligase